MLVHCRVVDVRPRRLGRIEQVDEHRRRSVRAAAEARVARLHDVGQRDLLGLLHLVEQHLGIVKRVRVLPVDALEQGLAARHHAKGRGGRAQAHVSRGVGLPRVVALRQVGHRADREIAGRHADRLAGDDVRRASSGNRGRLG